MLCDFERFPDGLFVMAVAVIQMQPLHTDTFDSIQSWWAFETLQMCSKSSGKRHENSETQFNQLINLKFILKLNWQVGRRRRQALLERCLLDL